MTSESNDYEPDRGETASIQTPSDPGYARGYCTICGDREPDRVSRAAVAKRLVCAPCFKAFGAPQPCLRCGREVYEGDSIVSEKTPEEKAADEAAGAPDTPLSSNEYFFCDPCLEKNWPACLRVVERIEQGETGPLLNTGLDPLQLLQDAVCGDFRCPGCNALIEPDFDVCGLCGTKNPLQGLGLI